MTLLEFLDTPGGVDSGCGGRPAKSMAWRSWISCLMARRLLRGVSLCAGGAHLVYGWRTKGSWNGGRADNDPETCGASRPPAGETSCWHSCLPGPAFLGGGACQNVKGKTA
jgi:hypothetical protein